MGTVHKPTKKVWQGIIVLYDLVTLEDLETIPQRDADAVLRATQWAKRMSKEHSLGKLS